MQEVNTVIKKTDSVKTIYACLMNTYKAHMHIYTHRDRYMCVCIRIDKNASEVFGKQKN